MSDTSVIRLVYNFECHNSVIHSICYNNHLDSFISVDDYYMLSWQPFKEKLLKRVAMPPRTLQYIQCIIYIEIRQIYVASALDGTLKVYDPNLCEIATIYTGVGTIFSLVFDEGHNKLFAGGSDGCYAWELRTTSIVTGESIINAPHEFRYLSNFFFRSERSGNKQRKTAYSTWVNGLLLSSDRTRLYAQLSHQIAVYNTIDGCLIEEFNNLFPRKHGSITSFVLHEESNYILCGCMDGTIFVNSLHPVSTVFVFQEHNKIITSLVLYEAYRLVLSSSGDGTVRIWNLETRSQSHCLHIGKAINMLKFVSSKDSPAAFYCSVRHTIKLYCFESTVKDIYPTLSPITMLQRLVHPLNMLLKKSQRKFTESYAIENKINNLAIGEVSQIFEHESETLGEDSTIPTSITFAPVREQLIVAVSMDNTIRIFDGRAPGEAPAFSWIPSQKWPKFYGYSLHPMGRHIYILLGSNKVLRVGTNYFNDNEPEDHKENIIEINFQTSKYLHMESLKFPVQASAPLECGECTRKTLNVKFSIDSPNDVPKKVVITCICCCYFSPTVQTQNQILDDNFVTEGVLESLSEMNLNDAKHNVDETNSSEKLINSHSKHHEQLQSMYELRLSSHRSELYNTLSAKWEWLVCGSENGQLTFWHSGLLKESLYYPENNICVQAHDAAIVLICASALHPILITLDANHLVCIWRCQPLFCLQGQLLLHGKPSCFHISPTFGIVLLGFEDGLVNFLNFTSCVNDNYQQNNSLEDIEVITNTKNHAALVSAGDFLDEEKLILTTSVDETIKIWTHDKQLLKQIKLASPITSLCFMNGRGDVVVGMKTGLSFIAKEDILPRKANAWHRTKEASISKVKSHLSTQKIENENERKTNFEDFNSTYSPCLQMKGPQFTSTASEHVSYNDDNSITQKDCEGISNANTEPNYKNLNNCEHSAIAEFQHCFPITGDLALHVPLHTYIPNLEVPILRTTKSDVTKSQILEESIINSDHEFHQSNTLSFPPIGNEGGIKKTAGEGDRQQLLCTFTERDQGNTNWRYIYRRSPVQNPIRWQSPREQKKLQITQQEIPKRNRNTNTSAAVKSPTQDCIIVPILHKSPIVGSTAMNNQNGFGIGSETPMQYCKHFTPVPPKVKTPRRLWNAVGGEVRRLLVLQKNSNTS